MSTSVAGAGSGLRRRGAAAALLLLLAAGCKSEQQPPSFPKPSRPVAEIVASAYSNEDARDKAGEAGHVIRIAGVKPGMAVADIGAGQGYFTVRLAPVVGKDGRVLAEDIIPATRDALATRVERERLDNVAVRLGTPDDPMLPAASFDRIFMVRMYHEITQPYAFLWHMRPGLKPGGQVVVVDADRPTAEHGTPPALLVCEFAAVGYALVRREDLPGADGYVALFEAQGPRPAPETIKPCQG